MWAGAVATEQDLLERVGCAYWDSAPPPPPSPPPVPGGAFSPDPGACRDVEGRFSNRLDHEGDVSYSECRQQCIRLGDRCDAYDIFGPAPAADTDPTVGWCGVWGVDLSQADEDLAAGFKFYASGGGRVCHGDLKMGKGNTGFRRPPFCNVSATGQ
jgi:hypothetical protein